MPFGATGSERSPQLVQQLWLSKLLADEAIDDAMSYTNESSMEPATPAKQTRKNRVRALMGHLLVLFRSKGASNESASPRSSREAAVDIIDQLLRDASDADKEAHQTWTPVAGPVPVLSPSGTVEVVADAKAPSTVAFTPFQVQQLWLASKLRDDALSVTSHTPTDDDLGSLGSPSGLRGGRALLSRVLSLYARRSSSGGGNERPRSFLSPRRSRSKSSEKAYAPPTAEGLQLLSERQHLPYPALGISVCPPLSLGYNNEPPLARFDIDASAATTRATSAAGTSEGLSHGSGGQKRRGSGEGEGLSSLIREGLSSPVGSPAGKGTPCQQPLYPPTPGGSALGAISPVSRTASNFSSKSSSTLTTLTSTSSE